MCRKSHIAHFVSFLLRRTEMTQKDTPKVALVAGASGIVGAARWLTPCCLKNGRLSGYHAVLKRMHITL